MVGSTYAKPKPNMDTTNQITETSVNALTVNRAKFTRRGFLGVGSAALAMAGIAPAMAGDRSRSDPGPTNSGLDAQNPDSMWPPNRDSKSLIPTFKYPFSLANKRVYEGGWSREVTVRELPASKSMAGVNIRLTAGGVRELHWHTAGEWAIMLYGTARITAIDVGIDKETFNAIPKDEIVIMRPSRQFWRPHRRCYGVA
jgi:hypothetical protein